MSDFTRFAGQIRKGDLWFNASLDGPYRNSIALRACISDGYSVSRLLPAQLSQEEELGQSIEPFLILPLTTAQTLIDQLWNCGLRPTEGAGSAGAMAAVQAHLKDMQRRVFKEKRP